MVKVLSSISGAIIGGFAASGALVTYLDWGTPGTGQVTRIDPTRAN